MQAVFGASDVTASKRISRLSYIIGQLNVRYNAFAILLNISALWDLQWVYQLEKWKKQEKDHLPGWFEALATFEALCSYANLNYNNPSWSFPDVGNKNSVDAEALGHPLIHESERICNDINIPLNGHIKLVTGSNMAGKSTFLRTVGLNIILALSGAPVCAKRLSLPHLIVYTSMRTQDALHESTSSFYAELKRLKFIIEAVEEQAGIAEDSKEKQHVFFLLDEILKGTNSVDRHTGSKALIRQLIESKGSGIIATHDLELGKLEESYGGHVENLCIEVEIKDGKLYFDYKLKKGVSESFNATLLMQNMGIKISDQ
jgi:DNA mismatch repair ATPase MutS